MEADTRYYRVEWSEEDQAFVGTYLKFPSLSWLDKTEEGALKGIQELVLDTLQDMDGHGH
jgi:hypothetical protein